VIKRTVQPQEVAADRFAAAQGFPLTADLVTKYNNRRQSRTARWLNVGDSNASILGGPVEPHRVDLDALREALRLDRPVLA